MPKKYILFTIIGIVAIVAVSVFVAKNSTVKTVSPEDPNRPIAEVTETNFDLGKMKVSDTREHDFKITNKGKNNLVLSEMSTSCDCTYGYIIKSNGEKTPKFSMRGGFGAKSEIAPGDWAVAKVVYDPSIMPVEGPVSRFASIGTNDPKSPKLQFTVSANVSKGN